MSHRRARRSGQPLSDQQIRRRIARRAAHLLLAGEAGDVIDARRRAACQMGAGAWSVQRLPTTGVIREQLLELAESANAGPHDAEPVNCQAKSADRHREALSLLLPLEQIVPPRHRHPEGDLLYHSLQVFHFAREELPYDQDFLWAALLHEVGWAIDPKSPELATLAVLDEFVEPRSLWLIEHLASIRPMRDGSLGIRARRRLVQHPWYPELPTLADCDAAGHQAGLAVDDLDDALAYLETLERDQS
jgi:predicted HD phosphohydrolase